MLTLWHCLLLSRTLQRTLKLTRDRYVQDHLSTTSTNSEGVRLRDIQVLRNDVLSFRYYVQLGSPVKADANFNYSLVILVRDEFSKTLFTVSLVVGYGLLPSEGYHFEIQ